jgi:hypothetical protein
MGAVNVVILVPWRPGTSAESGTARARSDGARGGEWTFSPSTGGANVPSARSAREPIMRVWTTAHWQTSYERGSTRCPRRGRKARPHHRAPLRDEYLRARRRSAQRLRPVGERVQPVGTVPGPLPEVEDGRRTLVPDNVRLSHQLCNMKDFGRNPAYAEYRRKGGVGVNAAGRRAARRRRLMK